VGEHLTWDEYVHAIKDPTTGMDAYVYNMTKNFQHEPQQTEMQRIGPDIKLIFDDWETPQRARAAHNHLLAALSMRPMGNYDYAFVQREVLRTFPIEQVQHLFCVLCNGSGCAVQIIETPCLTARDVLEVVIANEHDKLWQKRLPNWKRLGVEGKETFGPLFKVPVRFMDKNMTADERRPAWADPDKTPAAFDTLPKMRTDETGALVQDEDLTDHVMMGRLVARGCSSGDDTAIYSAELDGPGGERRTVLMYVSQCTAVDAAFDLVLSLYDRMVSNYRTHGQVAPTRRMFTAQTPNQSRGTSVKDSNHGSFVTDLLTNQAWDTDGNSALMRGAAVIDEACQACGRPCELRRAVPADALKYQAEGGPLNFLKFEPHLRDYSDEVYGLFNFCEDNPRYVWTNSNKRNLIQTGLNASQELMLGLKNNHALGRPTEAIVAEIVAANPDGPLHKALFAPIAFAKPKKGELPRPVYMAMGSEKAADEIAREAIAEDLADASVNAPQAITLDRVDASAQVRARIVEMHTKAQRQQSNAVIPAAISEVDASMHVIALLRESADERARQKQQQLKTLKDERAAREKSIKNKSRDQHSAINPSPRNIMLREIHKVFTPAEFNELVVKVKVYAEADPQPGYKRVKNRDFVTWCIFAVGSLLRFHAANPSEGQLFTANLQDLLLDKRTNENMKRYVSAYTTGSYVNHVMSGWNAFHKALSAIASCQAAAQAGTSGAGSSNAPLLLLHAESEGGATDAPSPVGSMLVDLVSD